MRSLFLLFSFAAVGFETVAVAIVVVETKCSRVYVVCTRISCSPFFVLFFQNPEAEVDGKNFFDFGYGNATGYYDVSTSTPGVPCFYGPQHRATWDEEGEGEGDPAEACYTGTYSTDAFVGRARQVLCCTVVCCTTAVLYCIESNASHRRDKMR